MKKGGKDKRGKRWKEKNAKRLSSDKSELMEIAAERGAWCLRREASKVAKMRKKQHVLCTDGEGLGYYSFIHINTRVHTHTHTHTHTNIHEYNNTLKQVCKVGTSQGEPEMLCLLLSA